MSAASCWSRTNPASRGCACCWSIPKARGLGLGQRLVDECVRFARKAGYKKITLWTHSILAAARHTYEKAGFTLTSSEKKRSWGKDVVAEYWDLDL